MDFALFSRLASILLAPSNFLLLLLVAGISLLWTRFSAFGRGLIATVTVILALIYFLPIDRWLAEPLENRFMRPAWPSHVDGILILGGGLNATIFTDRGVPAPDPSDGRLLAGAELLRRYPSAKLIYSGGAGSLAAGSLPETTVARSVFSQIGISPDRVMWENRARNTWENFVYSKQLAHPQPDEVWMLVTSAVHMPRAMGVAAKLHWKLIPWPADYITSGKDDTGSWNQSFARHLDTLEGVVHEWAGLAVYKFTGRWTQPSWL